MSAACHCQDVASCVRYRSNYECEMCVCMTCMCVHVCVREREREKALSGSYAVWMHPMSAACHCQDVASYVKYPSNYECEMCVCVCVSVCVCVCVCVMCV